MPEIDLNAVTQLLFNMTKVISAAKMYSPKHPAVGSAAREAFAYLEKILLDRADFTIGTREGVLIVDENPIQQEHGPIRALAETMARKGLHSFTFRRGATQDELIALAQITTMKEEEIVADGEINPDLRKRFKHIDLNLLKYRLVGSDSEEEDTHRQSGDGPPTPGAIAQQIANSLAAVLAGEKLFSPEELQAQIAAGIGDVFLQAAGDHCHSVADLRESLSQVVLALNPDIQLRLYGKHLSSEEDVDLNAVLPHLRVEQKAQMLAKDALNSEVSGEDLAGSMGALAPGEADVVALSDAISAQIAAVAATVRDRSQGLGKFFGAMRANAAGGPRYTAAIVSEDPETLSHYHSAFPLDRVHVATFTNSTTARDYIQANQPDLVVADSTLSSQAGLAVIRLMYHADMQTPVIACADYAEFAEKPEVRNYPNARFLLTPVSEDRVREAVEAFLPLDPDEAEKREDLRRARQIQEKLLPRSLPNVPHFSISGFYKACKGIGGDYYDVIPLSKSQYGILVADVSGKGVSGALVMVMFRSMFRMIAEADLPPKETLTRVNDMLSADIKRGMFVTAVYMQLDTATDTLTMCSAGHNPAVFWRNTDIIKPQMLIPSGMALGVTRGRLFANAIKERSIHLESGDLLFLYTDGIVEAMNHAGEEYTTGRLLQTIARTASQSTHNVVGEVIRSVDEHKGVAEQHDDITVLAIKYSGDGTSESIEPIFPE